MNVNELRELEGRLQQIRRELMERDAESREAARRGKLDKCAIDPLSRMELIQSREVAAETERRRQQRLREVDEAVQRMGRGHYGRCLSCGEEIDLRRLRLNPAATHCVRCVRPH